MDDRAESENRIGTNQLLANFTATDGAALLLTEEPSRFRLSAIDSKSGRAVWNYPHSRGITNAAGVIGSDGRVADVVFQFLQPDRPTLTLLDAKTGRVRWTLPIHLGNLVRAVACDDEGNSAIWILANAAQRSGLELLKVQRVTGQVLWQRHFFDGFHLDLVRTPKVAMLRVDCNNDGILDAVVPDDGILKPLAISAISGATGKRLWTQDILSRSDRWSNEVDWPPMIATGPDDDPRIIVMDVDGTTSFALRMISANRGDIAAEIKFDANFNHAGSGSFHMQGFGRLVLAKLHGDDPWTTLTVAHPQRAQGSKTTFKQWFQLSVTEDGFGEPADLRQQARDGSHWFVLDVDGDGQPERVELTSNHLRCLARDNVLFEQRFERDVVFDRIHAPGVGNPCIGLYVGDSETYALYDLTNGRQIFRSDSPGTDFTPNQYNPHPTPLLQSSGDELRLLRTTRDGIRSIGIAQANQSMATSGRASLLPSLADPRKMSRLPTSPLWGGQTLAAIVRSLASGLILTLFALILPAAYINRLIVRRKWTLGYLLLSPVVTVLALLAWRFLLDPARTVSIDPNAKEPWPFVLLGGCIVSAAIAFLFRAVRERRYGLLSISIVIASLLTLLMIGAPLLTQLISADGRKYQWGIEDVLVLMIYMSINVMMFASLIWRGVSVIHRRLTRMHVAKTLAT